MAIGAKYNAPVIALNAPFSKNYDVGGGKPFTLAYVMKRIPKGDRPNLILSFFDIMHSNLIPN